MNFIKMDENHISHIHNKILSFFIISHGTKFALFFELY